MKVLFQNDYGTCYAVDKSSGNFDLLLMIDAVGVFLYKEDLEPIKQLINNSLEPCNCPTCNGKPCNKIWYKTDRINVCFSLEQDYRKLFLELIQGCSFQYELLEMKDSLQIS